jgi:uncharacterized protein YcfJ
MKLALTALLLLTSAIPAEAKPSRYDSRPGWAQEEKCYRKEYREEYVPGTSNSPGYVKTYRERVEVRCERETHTHSNPPNVGHTDDNSCIEGSILGGIAGGGAGAALSRGDGRIWAIPLGIVTGVIAGCQIDGG